MKQNGVDELCHSPEKTQEVLVLRGQNDLGKQSCDHETTQKAERLEKNVAGRKVDA